MNLACFLFSLAQYSSSSSLLKSHAVQAAVYTRFVTSSMKHRRGGLAPIKKVSKAVVHRMGEMEHPIKCSPAKLLPVSCVVQQQVANLQICIVALDDLLDTWQHMEEDQNKAY